MNGRRGDLEAAAGDRLAASLDHAETLAAVTDVLVPDYADWCFVELRRPDGGIERAAIAHADPAKRRFAEEYERRFPLDPAAPAGSPAVIRSGRPELLEEVPDALLEQVITDPEQLWLLRSAGFRSSLVVPLRVRGTVIGDLALAHAESGRRFRAEDVGAVQALADRCALALDNARLYTEARLARDELRVTLDSLADAVTVQGPDARLVYANAAAARAVGLASAAAMLTAPPESYARRFEILDEHGVPLPLERLPGRRALAGEDPDPVTLRYRERDTGEERWSRVKATPVLGADGAVRLAVNVVEDVTELKRAEHAERFLADAGRLLAGSLDVERTLATVAGLAVPRLAGYCVATAAGARAAAGEEPGAHQLVVPIADEGSLALSRDRPFDPGDADLARALALRAAAAVENARLYDVAARIARTLQTSLLPPRLPDLPGVEAAAVYRPAAAHVDVGGDFYDVFATDDEHWFAVIGDVCGKGAEAAAVTALARYTLRSAAVGRRSPAAILRFVSESMRAQPEAAGRFATIACAHLDLSGGRARVTVACGGHPLPIVRRADGRVHELGAPGTLLGLVAGPQLEERTTYLEHGDILVLYTDGLSEAQAPETLWEVGRLLDEVAAADGGSAAALVETLVEAALTDVDAPRDDLAVLALRRI